MYFDYHLHSNFSHDSKTPMEDIVKAALKLPLKEICITDHVDYNVIFHGKDTNYDFSTVQYFSTISYLQKIYANQITIKKGVEIGLQPHILRQCSQYVENYDFDFVIASIHSINKYELIHKHLFRENTQKEAYEIYYKTLYHILNNFKNYSVVGHLDLIKRYDPFPSILKDNEFLDILDEILKIIILDGKGIEINTSSFRYGLPNLTPSTFILKRYKQLGGTIITTGSDAHTTKHIADNFPYIYHILKQLGFQYVCTFQHMQPIFHKL